VSNLEKLIKKSNNITNKSKTEMELKKPNRSPPAESMTSPTKITLLKNRYKHELADIRMEDKVEKKKIQPNTRMQNKNMKRQEKQ